MFSLSRAMWKAVSGSPPHSVTGLTEERARQLRAQVERDLMDDVKRLLDEVKVTAETLNRRYDQPWLDLLGEA